MNDILYDRDRMSLLTYKTYETYKTYGTSTTSGTSATLLFLLFTYPSAQKTISATHTKLNPMKSDRLNGSRYTSTPSKNCRVGAKYWRMPTMERGMLWAAEANNSSGTVVITPVPIISKFCRKVVWMKAPC